MPEHATIYLPFPFPGEAFLQFLCPDGVASSGQRLQWAGGSMQVNAMARAEVGPHLQGLLGYPDQHGAGPAARVRALHTQGVLGLVVEPELLEPTAWELVQRMVAASDGLVLLPDGNLYTATGATLLGAGLEAPSPERVARRALVLLALSVRCLLDDDAGTDDEPAAEALREELWAWLEAQDVIDEAEPDEATVLQASIGTLPDQAIVDGVWRAEGAQVLLWALGARDLPAHDAQEHPYEVARAVGLRDDAPCPLLHDPDLRGAHALEDLRLQLQGVAWRFTEYRMRPEAIDFAAFAARAPMGAFPVEGLPLVGGDLAVQGEALGDADPDVLQLCASIARERLIAANWLVGVNPVYGRVDAPT